MTKMSSTVNINLYILNKKLIIRNLTGKLVFFTSRWINAWGYTDYISIDLFVILVGNGRFA